MSFRTGRLQIEMQRALLLPMQLKGRVVLITGASEGIGAACAEAFRRRGAALSLCARSEHKLRSVAGADALVNAGDLLDPDVRRLAVERTIDRYGRIDVLLNNAGVGLYAPAYTSDFDDLRRMWELNFFVALDLIQRVVPHMRQQGGGSLVNVSSIAGKVTLPWFTLYSASKFALCSLSDGLRMELRRHGIHAMKVCPGYVQTRFQQNVLHGQPPPLIGRRKAFAISAERCAEDIARGLERDARTVVTPRVGWLFIAAARLMPSLMERQLEKIYLKQDAHR
jgi:short-subunit dehydrogenase